MAKKPEPRTFSSGLDIERRRAEEFVARTQARLAGTHEPPALRRLAKAKLKRKHHMIIGDSHAHPDDPNHRFEWLGRMVADRKPDVLVDIGDSADMASLFGYEYGAKGPMFEGHRYWRDVDAYIDAQERLFGAMGAYRPKVLIKTQGNHEERITRMLVHEPRFIGVVGLHNLAEREFGWDVYPYGEPVNLDGVLYCHAFLDPDMGRPIAGVMATRQMILKLPGSASRVQGHSHRYQMFELADESGGPEPQGRKITAIHGGCYFDLASNAHRWAGRSVNKWRSGILELWLDEGQIHDFQWTGYDQVRALYG